VSHPVLRLGPFHLGAVLGAGGTGQVYHAVHEPSGLPAAVKVVRLTADRRPVRNALSAEVRAVVTLDHPRIVQVYDVGEVDEAAAAAADGRLLAGTPWYAMELAEEGSLQTKLRQLASEGDERDEGWARLSEVWLDLLDALAHAHAREVLHLDLKPENVLFGGRRPGAKLSDFGMGVVGPVEPGDDVARGTPHYMAPEQVRGRWEELGPWTDLYALGCLVWRCVTGAPPFVGDTPREVLEQQVQRGAGAFVPRLAVPPELEAWVRKLLHKDPLSRFRWAADAAASLRELLGKSAPSQEDWRVPEQQGAAEVASATGLGLGALREPPIVGRTREREQLWDALRRARAGEVRIEVIRGPRGIGKTRLARWLGIRAHELGAGVVLTAAHRRGEDPVATGIVYALRRVVPVELDSDEALADLGARLQAAGLPAPFARDAAELIARGPHPDGPGREGGDLSGERSWFEVIEDLLTVVAAERTPVVLLDDVQWGGASLACAAWLLLTGRSPPAVWVLTVDDDLLQERPEEARLLMGILALSQARTVPLGPLSEQANVSLARRLLPLEPSLSAELASRGAGSPWLQVELIRDWAARGQLEPGASGFRLRADTPRETPADAAADGLAWLMGVGDVLRPLEVAAVLGVQVEVGEWQSACAELGLEVSPPLVLRLLGERIIRLVDDRRWAFVNVVTRDALLTRATAEGRAAELHRACARVVDPRDPFRRATHLLAGDRPDEALPALLETMRRVGVGDIGRAEQLLHTTEEVACKLLVEPSCRAIIEDFRVRLLLATGRPEEAGQAASRGRAAAEGDDRLAFAAERNQATVALELGTPELALYHAALAESFALRLQDAVAVASAWVMHSAALRALGRIAEARRTIEFTSLLMLPPQSPICLEVWLETALVAAADGRHAAARRALERLAVAGEASRSMRATGVAALRSGDTWLALGDGARAFDAYRVARRRFRALAHADEHIAQLGLAAALLALGRAPEADELLERVRDRELSPRARLRHALVEVALRSDRGFDLAYERHWRTALELLPQLGTVEPAAGPLLALAASRTTRPERLHQLEAERERISGG
jgi:tetratricopeptide (TPR) repeat protein